MRQFTVFVTKEFRHILRDKRTMLILVVMPVVMIILFGFAITTEVKDSRVAVLDYSKDEVTAQIVEHIAHNRYFTIVSSLESEAEIERVFLQNKADMVIAFSRNFASEMSKSGQAKVQILTDGSEPNQASVRTGYMQQVLAAWQQEQAQRAGMKPSFQIKPVTRFLYNPQSKSEYNFVPGMIGLILLLICAMMTSIAIVKEKEMGTMEILLASPLTPSVVLLHIPIAGSITGFVAITMLYVLVSLLLGLFISTCVGSQLAAMLLSLLLIVPTVYLSGIAFPIESMPEALQRASVIVPARWYVDIARRLMIQGVPMRYVIHETMILAAMAAVLLSVSWKMFKTRL